MFSSRKPPVPCDESHICKFYTQGMLLNPTISPGATLGRQGAAESGRPIGNTIGKIDVAGWSLGLLS